MFYGIIKINSVEHLNESYFIVTLDIGKYAEGIKAGQFFELKIPECCYPMLRKPISVYDAQGNTVSFMIKKLGKATQQFAELKAGEELDIIGPLGNSFPITNIEKAVLISGGIGYPPLYFLKKQMEKVGKKVYWLHGGQSSKDIYPADEIWTDDGSAGEKGFVIDGLINYVTKQKPDIIYACGPKEMLKACSQIAEQHNVPLYVSLEEYMACGIGVCYGCAVKVKSDNSIGVTYKTVCKDGPVFDAKEVVWE